MVTTYPDARGNIVQVSEDDFKIIAPANSFSPNHGWDICPHADSGCEGALDKNNFKIYCSNGENACLLPQDYTAPKILPGFQQEYVGVPMREEQKAINRKINANQLDLISQN